MSIRLGDGSMQSRLYEIINNPGEDLTNQVQELAKCLHDIVSFLESNDFVNAISKDIERQVRRR